MCVSCLRADDPRGEHEWVYVCACVCVSVRTCVGMLARVGVGVRASMARKRRIVFPGAGRSRGEACYRCKLNIVMLGCARTVQVQPCRFASENCFDLSSNFCRH